MRDPAVKRSELPDGPVTLTDRLVASLKPRKGRARDDVFDTVVPGLACRVSRAGTRSWVLKYQRRIRNEQTGRWDATNERGRWSIGVYPTLTLAAAREMAQSAKTDLQQRGIDPSAGKREARTGATFGDLADEYLKRHAKAKKRSWTQDERTLNEDILKYWKSRPAKAIGRRDVHELIDRIIDRGSPVMANRALALVRKVFNYGVQKDWIDGNPASLITKQPEASRDRVLSDEEVKALWDVLENAKTLKRVTDDEDSDAPAVSPTIALGLQMLLLTAQRPGEVFSMRWADLDERGGWWTIPGDSTKNGEPHRVPLTKRALGVLADAKKSRPDNNAHVFAGTQGASVAARAKKAAAALRRARVIDFEFQRRDLRRTAATGMARAKIVRGTISHVLNHVEGGPRATAVYDRYAYDAEKRTALEAWGRRLDAIISGAAARSLLPFKRGGRRARAAR